MCGERKRAVECSTFLIVLLCAASASAELAVKRVEIAPPAKQSRVPATTSQGRTLAAQAVSCVDISADGKFITVGTMAHSHDANVWQFAPDGTLLAKRHFPPWAPMQVATLDGGKALAVSLAYSRVTSPEPTVWFGPADELLRAPLKDTFVEADTRDSELARLRRLAHGLAREPLRRAVPARAGLGVQAVGLAPPCRRLTHAPALRGQEPVAHQSRHAHGREP